MTALFDLPHREAAAALATGAPVYVPVNPVEYHGPHLSLHNDRLVSRGLIERLHARRRVKRPDEALLVADELEVGVEPCPGPGTRHTPFDVACAVVTEATRALLELGARRVVYVTFHGAPLHNLALERGVQQVRSSGGRAVAPLHVLLRELASIDDTSRYAPAVAHLDGADLRASILRGLREDFHAGFFETSVALHLAPNSVAALHRALPPCPAIAPDPVLARAASVMRLAGKTDLARELDVAALGRGWYALRPFPGYTGRPASANATSGAFFVDEMVQRFGDAIDRVLDDGDAPPAPVMAWTEKVSLGGRIPSAHVDVGDVLRVLDAR